MEKYAFAELREERLYNLLRKHGGMLREELREELDVSARHLLRLITRLREKGVPIEERRMGRKKQVLLAPGERDLSEGIRLQCTEEEALTLLLSLNAARAAIAPTPLADARDSLHRQLVDEIGDRPISFEPDQLAGRLRFDPTVHPHIQPEVFRAVLQALVYEQPLRIDYHTASTGRHWENRRVDPQLLSVRGTTWLLTAWCHVREGLRDFALSSISRVEVVDDGTRIKKVRLDDEEHFRYRFCAMEGEENYIIRLEVQPSRATFFERKEYHPMQMIDEKRPDGSLVVSYEVSGLDEFAAFVRSWGPYVRVLDPEALRDRIAREAAEVTRLYEENTKSFLSADYAD